MEAVYRFEATLTESVPVGLVPEGVRLDVHFEGEVVEGALTGARVRGIDYLLLRADGVGVIVAVAAAVGVGSESSESLIGVPRLSVGMQAEVIAAVKTRAANASCVRPSIFMDEGCYLQKQIWVIWANYSLTLMTP